MFEDVVKSIVKKMLSTQYPHISLPSALRARVSVAHELDTHYEYTLKILTKEGLEDKTFPAIPFVRSKTRYELGATLAVVLLYGETDPYIMGEVL